MVSVSSIEGCLLGTAAGDSLGLCYEGISPRRQKLLYKDISRHRFFFSKGMVSDDTDHTIMASTAIVASGGDSGRFASDFAASLKYWFLTVPPGVGFATLRACFKLLAGISPEKSGVFSAGNGPAMRSAIFGVCFGGDTEKMKAFVRASTIVTHSDPKAYEAALAVALAAHLSTMAAEIGGDDFVEKYSEISSGAAGDELKTLLRRAAESVKSGETTAAFAESLCGKNGVGGYSYHTVPAVIHCWLRNRSDFRSAILEMIACGGDADTTAAILGGIIGARVGPEGIPAEWTDNMVSWPYTAGYMKKTAGAVLDVLSGKPDVYLRRPPAILSLFKNLLTLAAMPVHIIRRALPPY